jgi:16S rRNA C967 or C1407 C5-methylase (RsmB/RsmF family)
MRLPVVFRINCNQPNWMAFAEKLISEDLVKKQMEKIEGEYEPTEQIKVQKIDWYPNMLVYSINTTKQQFKKSKTLEELHSYIEKASDVGLVTRQELVSMIPPLFLGIQSTDMVLDMCAAPGSKTSQML